MPYDPVAVDQTQREAHYHVIWFGAACSVVTFADAFIGWSNTFTAIATGGAAGGFMLDVSAHRTDDCFQSLSNMGLRWALFSVAAYLFVRFVLNLGDVTYSAGYAMANTANNGERDTLALFWTNIRTLSAFPAVAYCAGYTFARFKDRFGAGSP